MSWANHLARQSIARRAIAAEGTASIVEALIEAGWRLTGYRAAAQQALRCALGCATTCGHCHGEGEVHPGATALRVSLGRSEPTGIRPTSNQTLWRERLFERANAQSDALHAKPAELGTPEGRAVCVVEHLLDLGRTVAQDYRHAWRTWRHPVDAELDARAARLWAGWDSGQFWQMRDEWEQLYLAPATRAMLVEAGRAGARPRLVPDFREAFFLLCVDGCTSPRDQPVWRKLRARVIESGPQGPLAALAGCLPPVTRAAVHREAVRHGTRSQTAALAFPDLRGAEVRSRALAHRTQADPDVFEGALDLHVLVRLLDHWRTTDPTPAGDRAVIAQNRGRARGRLRAVVAALPTVPPLREAGLHARTLAAVARFFRDWGRAQAPDYPMGGAARVDPPCDLTLQPAFSPAQMAALDCWVFLGLLRGHGARLSSWVARRSPGQRSAAFDRYLKELPADLLRSTVGDKGGREFVRGALWGGLGSIVDRHRPQLERIAQAPDRSWSVLHEAIRPVWHPAVRMPGGRLQEYFENAKHALNHPGASR